MEAQGGQGGGGGTEATGEGEDEESSSSCNVDRSIEQLRSLLEEENQGQLFPGNGQDSKEGAVSDQNQAGGESKGGNGKGTEKVLEQFRRQWRSELQKASVSTSKTSSRDGSPAVSSPRASKESTPSISDDRSSKNQSETAPVVNSEVVEKASRLFQSGIDFERQGKMYDAIRSYRQALQLVPDIEKRLLVSSNSGATASGRTYAMVASEPAADKRRRVYVGAQLPASTTPEQLLEIFRHRLFVTTGGRTLCLPGCNDNEDGEENQYRVEKPKEESNGVHISELPTEVLMRIFKWVISSELDMRHLEHLSMVCCGFYIAARAPELWRLACVKVWGVRLGILDSVYSTWRQMYIERPHLRYNGVYISKITYVRHGETAYQDQFYRPWHLVVYYRYLKFFADGTALMLTTPDEPSAVVAGLKWKQPRFQGVLKGTYRLVGHNCVAVVFTRKNTADSTSSPYIRNRVVKQPNDLMEHVFSLVLNINSVKRRCHVQLSWSSYEATVRYRNGQASTSKFELCDQNFPPLYFSRVKSFSATTEAPLE